MSTPRITSSCAWEISCVAETGRLFPITAKLSDRPFAHKHVPAVHIEPGLYMPPGNVVI